MPTMKITAILGLLFVTFIGALPLQLALVLMALTLTAVGISIATRRKGHKRFVQSQMWLRDQVARR